VLPAFSYFPELRLRRKQLPPFLQKKWHLLDRQGGSRPDRRSNLHEAVLLYHL